MRCRVNAKKFAKVLTFMTFSRYYPRARLEATTNSLQIDYLDGAIQYSVSVSVDTEACGVSHVDIGMLRQIVSNFDGEIVLDGQRGSRLIVEGNNGSSIYCLPLYDGEEMETIKLDLDNAVPYAVFLDEIDLRKITNKLSPFREKFSLNKHFVVFPDAENGKVMVVAFQDPIAAAVSLPAEVYSDEILLFPEQFPRMPLRSICIGKSEYGSRVIGISEHGCISTVVETISDHARARLLTLKNLFVRPANCKINVDLTFWRSFSKFLQLVPRQSQRHQVRMQCVFDFSKRIIYATDWDEVVYRYDRDDSFSLDGECNRPIVCNAELLKMTLSLIPIPTTFEILPKQIIRFQFKDWSVLIAALSQEVENEANKSTDGGELE